MKIETEKSYNIVCDDMKDIGSGGLAYLLSNTIYRHNLSVGLEDGIPFISELGVIQGVSKPQSSLIVISVNDAHSDKTDLDISADINEIIKYLLSRQFNVNIDIRRIKALTKPFKKTQSYRKYLKCVYVLVCEMEDSDAEAHIKDSTDFGLPYYVKVREIIKLLENLTHSSLNRLLFFRSVWGEETLLSIFKYLTGDRDLPSYIVDDFKDIILSSVYQVNLINFGIALGKGQLNKFILQELVKNEN